MKLKTGVFLIATITAIGLHIHIGSAFSAEIGSTLPDCDDANVLAEVADYSGFTFASPVRGLVEIEDRSADRHSSGTRRCSARVLVNSTTHSVEYDIGWHNEGAGLIYVKGNLVDE